MEDEEAELDLHLDLNEHTDDIKPYGGSRSSLPRNNITLEVPEDADDNGDTLEETVLDRVRTSMEDEEEGGGEDEKPAGQLVASSGDPKLQAEPDDLMANWEALKFNRASNIHEPAADLEPEEQEKFDLFLQDYFEQCDMEQKEFEEIHGRASELVDGGGS